MLRVVAGPPFAGAFVRRAATGLVTVASPRAAGGLWATVLTVALTILLPAASLLRRRPTRPRARALAEIEAAPFQLLQDLHSGRVTDYVVWMVVGLAVLVGLLRFG